LRFRSQSLRATLCGMSTVLLTGGTGVLGSELAPRLRSAGHTVRVMSRRPRPQTLEGGGLEWAQADLMTGDGLAEAARGADIVLHAGSSPMKDTRDVDVHGTERLLKASEGASHFYYISIVGVDRISFGYYKAKLAAEHLIEASGVPFSIRRATQFHQLIDGFLPRFIRLPVAPIPTSFNFQLIDAGEVAERIVSDIAQGPSGRLPDIGGPKVQRLGEIARAWLAARGKRALLLPLPLPGAMPSALRKGLNCCPDNIGGSITWEEWLAGKYGD